MTAGTKTPVRSVHRGQVVEIMLSTPMTGHRWTLDEPADSGPWRLLDRATTPGQAIGEGPRIVWRLSFQKAGIFEVVARLRRPTDANDARVRVFPFEVKD